jgi:hypothetical protein
MPVALSLEGENKFTVMKFLSKHTPAYLYGANLYNPVTPMGVKAGGINVKYNILIIIFIVNVGKLHAVYPSGF